ncbi:MAG: thiamine pyrophosphate-binding protein [Acidobacteria bacterium]|nr:thiamine pyrophosphate-binding protein [Acidobacteriota bacterium]
MNGGELVARVLSGRGVQFLFTLCGGHISPILVESKRLGVRVIDVRHEVNAVFAADAVARLTGIPGVAAVTAGPGVTNTITAVKNAQMAQSPIVLLGGATATVLKNRGSLQDIDQMSLMAPHVKWATSVGRVKHIVPVLEHAFDVAQAGVPGPVFVELPMDVLYSDALVREWYGLGGDEGGSWSARAQQAYLKWHARRLFSGVRGVEGGAYGRPEPVEVSSRQVGRAAAAIAKAERPVMVVGSQATLLADEIDRIASAIDAIGLPLYLSGMARGLLGKGHRLQQRHQRRVALNQADLVLLAGVPSDFRLDYGRHVRRGTRLLAVNRSPVDLVKNRRPDLALLGDPGRFLQALAERITVEETSIAEWLGDLRRRDTEREADIDRRAGVQGQHVNPLELLRQLERFLGDDSILVADGGDFVATASYTLSPRRPLSWLDPGVFGTLGVGGGFALGAKLCRPEADVWILYGDGSAAYSLAEFDTFVRHALPIYAVVGNDASWAQIAREQVKIFGDDVGTVLRRTDYHSVAEGYGGRGLLLDRPDMIGATLEAARAAHKVGKPVLINALLAKSDFRQGSISM